MKALGINLENVGKKREQEKTAVIEQPKSVIDYPRLSSYNAGINIPKGMKIGDKTIIVAQVELTSYAKRENDKGEISVECDFDVLKIGFQEGKQESYADKELREVDKKLKEESEKD